LLPATDNQRTQSNTSPNNQGTYTGRSADFPRRYTQKVNPAGTPRYALTAKTLCAIDNKTTGSATNLIETLAQRHQIRHCTSLVVHMADAKHLASHRQRFRQIPWGEFDAIGAASASFQHRRMSGSIHAGHAILHAISANAQVQSLRGAACPNHVRLALANPQQFQNPALGIQDFSARSLRLTRPAMGIQRKFPRVFGISCHDGFGGQSRTCVVQVAIIHHSTPLA
jgi:hypothetical protein